MNKHATLRTPGDLVRADLVPADRLAEIEAGRSALRDLDQPRRWRN